MLLRIEHLFSFEDSFNLPPPVPPEQGTVLLASRIVTTSAVSVRGPNLV
ncbi:hypothetical protein N9230_00515 [Akkermansiaceae bacterium]|jgi:hypothetical protein|nr:hypothetical protein [Akkermansiaceae bacterium]